MHDKILVLFSVSSVLCAKYHLWINLLEVKMTGFIVPIAMIRHSPQDVMDVAKFSKQVKIRTANY
jgi:hypothetical protein